MFTCWSAASGPFSVVVDVVDVVVGVVSSFSVDNGVIEVKPNVVLAPEAFVNFCGICDDK